MRRSCAPVACVEHPGPQGSSALGCGDELWPCQDGRPFQHPATVGSISSSLRKVPAWYVCLAAQRGVGMRLRLTYIMRAPSARTAASSMTRGAWMASVKIGSWVETFRRLLRSLSRAVNCQTPNFRSTELRTSNTVAMAAAHSLPQRTCGSSVVLSSVEQSVVGVQRTRRRLQPPELHGQVLAL